MSEPRRQEPDHTALAVFARETLHLTNPEAWRAIEQWLDLLGYRHRCWYLAREAFWTERQRLRRPPEKGPDR